jgi:hypothetical protein
MTVLYMDLRFSTWPGPADEAWALQAALNMVLLLPLNLTLLPGIRVCFV